MTTCPGHHLSLTFPGVTPGEKKRSMTTVAARFITFSAVSVAFAVLAAGTAAAAPQYGDGEVFAPIPAQATFCTGQPTCNGGFPEGVAVANDRVYVAGPATFGTAGKGPSVVTVFERSNGHKSTEIPIAGEVTSQEHAISGLAVDGDDRVYVLSTQLGVVRLARHGHTYTQTSYAPPFPNLPACTVGGPVPCSPTPLDLPPPSLASSCPTASSLATTAGSTSRLSARARLPSSIHTVTKLLASPALRAVPSPLMRQRPWPLTTPRSRS